MGEVVDTSALRAELAEMNEVCDYYKDFAAQAEVWLFEEWASSEARLASEAHAGATEATHEAERYNDMLRQRLAMAEECLSNQAASHNEELQERLQVDDQHIKRRKNSLVTLYQAFHRRAATHESVLTVAASSESPPPPPVSTSRNRTHSPLIRPARSRSASPFPEPSAKSTCREGSFLRCVRK